MISNPKVTVIVPNYNHDKFLEERIDSILAQTYTDFEIIILDDYSTDSSRVIIKKYSKNPKVSCVIFNDSNTGNTFLQWEKGILAAKGKYIWIAESDDVALPDFLSANVLALDKNKSAVMSLSGSFFIDQNAKKCKKATWDQWKEDGSVKTYDGNKYIKRNLSFRNNVYNASMVLFRKDCFDNVNPSYKKLRYAGDWLFWINIAKQGDVIEVREKLNLFRQHYNKVTNRGSINGRSLRDELYVLSFLLKEKEIKSSLCLSTILKGRMYKRICKNKNISCDMKDELLKQAYHINHICRKHFIIERILKLFSFVLPRLFPTAKSFKYK